MNALNYDVSLVSDELETDSTVDSTVQDEDMARLTGQDTSTSGRDYLRLGIDEDEEALWRLALGQRPFSLSLMLILMRDSLSQGRGGKLELSRAVYGITFLARECQGLDRPGEVLWATGFDALSSNHKMRYVSFMSALESQVSLVNQGRCQDSQGSEELIQLLHGLAVIGRCNMTLVNGLLSLLVPRPDGSNTWASDLKAWQVIKLAWSLASLRWSPLSSPGGKGDLIVNELLRASLPILPGLGFSRAASLAWSMARISGLPHFKAGQRRIYPCPPDWWGSLEAATMVHVEGGPHRIKAKAGQAVALIWASGRLRPNPRPSSRWMRGIMSIIESSSARLNPTEVTMLMDGLAALKYRPPDSLIRGISLGMERIQRPANQLGNLRYKRPLELFSASQLQGLLFSSANLGYQITHQSVIEPTREEKREGLDCLHPHPFLQSAPLIVQSKLGGMSARQLIQSAASLQDMGLKASGTDFVIQWMEECHSKLNTFTPLQMIQLLRILSRWKFSPGDIWLSDLVAASLTKMHAFSRSRLVEFLNELSSPTLRFALDEAWLQSILECFISRNFKEPLPRHFITFAQSLAALASEKCSIGWSKRTHELLRKALPLSKVRAAIACSKGQDERRTMESMERLGLKD